MHELDDSALLRQYAERQSEQAFELLVARHVNKVYSVALRHTRNPYEAEEIAQAVFIILAKKARHLDQRVVLSGWLYHAARLTAVTFIRAESRRARREQEAHLQTIVNEMEPDVWTQIAPLLDAAMAGLNETDRHAVVLRYFDGKSLKDVGAALGANEDAAKKRVSRALEKLRKILAKYGVVSTTDAIAGAISAHSAQAAPPALAKTITAVVLAKSAAASSSTLTLIEGALKLMAWTKLKIAAVACVGLLLATSATIIAVKTLRAAAPDPVAERILGEYAQLFEQAQAQGQRGPTVEEVTQLMTNHPPLALIRLTHQKAPTMGARQMMGMGTSEGQVSLGVGLVPLLAYVYSSGSKRGDRFPFNRIIVSPEVQDDLLTFTAEDIADLPGIIERWRRQSDPVSAFLWQSLSANDQSVLTKFQPSEPTTQQAQAVVVQALNRKLKGTNIYQSGRFDGITLLPRTTNLMRGTQNSQTTLIVNRFLLQDAYSQELSRSLSPVRYDFVDTMPKGGREVLRRVLKDQFGLTARREMRENLVLTVKNPGVIALRKPADGTGNSTSTIESLAQSLTQHLGVEVTDQTGLAGEYNLRMNLSSAATSDDIRAAVLDQLGLELTPDKNTPPVEFLIAEKAK